eukprot:COSAG01_NODE_59035_length_302_cov_1.236453_1_plen_73_part_01
MVISVTASAHQALRELGAALRLFPRYRRALRERGLTLLDCGRPAVAAWGFAQLLRLEYRQPGAPPPPLGRRPL